MCESHELAQNSFKMDWGADRSVLLRLYCSFVRCRLEYGCAVLSSARKSYLKKLEPI